MRFYAGILTGITAGIIATELLWHLTQMEVIALMFCVMCVVFAAIFIFALITEPRKKKATRWVSGGGLDAMIMGKYNK